MLKKLLEEEIKKKDLKEEQKQEKQAEDGIESEEGVGAENEIVENQDYKHEADHSLEKIPQSDKKKSFWRFLQFREKAKERTKAKQAKKYKFAQIAKILLLARKLSTQIILDVEHRKRSKIKNSNKNEIMKKVVKVLYLSQNKQENMKEKIHGEILSIANLMNSHQSLCMEVLINQIRTNPAIDPSIAMYLERFAKQDFKINDGTHEIKNNHTQVMEGISSQNQQHL